MLQVKLKQLKTLVINLNQQIPDSSYSFDSAAFTAEGIPFRIDSNHLSPICKSSFFMLLKFTDIRKIFSIRSS